MMAPPATTSTPPSNDGRWHGQNYRLRAAPSRASKCVDNLVFRNLFGDKTRPLRRNDQRSPLTNTMSPRCSLLSKACAVWFVVFIVLPFTPPFQVWHDRVPISKAHSEDFKSPDNLSSDAAIVAWSPSAAVLTAGVAIERRPLRGPRMRHHTLPTVLRL
jgi:hypothetical protein